MTQEEFNNEIEKLNKRIDAIDDIDYFKLTLFVAIGAFFGQLIHDIIKFLIQLTT